jgi:hypothetical protein
VEAASIEELHQKIQTLEKENNKEEEYRNYMQLERVSSNRDKKQQHARQWLSQWCTHHSYVSGLLPDDCSAPHHQD